MSRHHRGLRSPASLGPLTTAVLGLVAAASIARADPGVSALEPIPPVTPDVPPRSGPPVVAPGTFRPSWDLDGFYLWLGPSGAATTVGNDWDSAFGGDLVALRLREAAPLAAIGGDFGFSKYSAHDGGRLWLDALAGVRIHGRILAGLTAGPLLEVSDIQHPRAGASVGAWAFVGVTPYVRVGTIQESGTFIEIGLRLVLPVLRR